MPKPGFKEFFWNTLAPIAAPVIECYHNDFYLHDRDATKDAFEHLDEFPDEFLWLVHNMGTHVIWKSCVLDNAKYYTTSQKNDFISDCWKWNHQGNDTVQLFHVSLKTFKVNRLSWEQCQEIFVSWLRQSYSKKKAA